VNGNAKDIRTDIQALRAVSVIAVVIFHYFPSALPGGYVGVDAFLVVSGYLITRQLIAAIRDQGSIHLGEFWARRARRLLPASFFVLATTLAAGIAFTPRIGWPDLAEDVGFSAAYALNFALAQRATDYFAQEAEVSPLQHFWSLCVEEQFYVVWPLLLAIVCLGTVGRKETRLQRVRILTVFGFVASFVACIVITKINASGAYFMPWTRAWEFLAGGAIAVFGTRYPRRAPVFALRWIGLTALVTISILLRSPSEFPGWIAGLPVVATLLVLIPESGGQTLVPPLLFRWLAPLGDISYGVYLWHWPLLIIFERHAGRKPGMIELCFLLSATLVLAALSKRFLEEKIRFNPWLVRARPRRTLALAAVGTACALGSAWAVRVQEASALDAGFVRRVADNKVPCFGALSKRQGKLCENPELEGFLSPSPIVAKGDKRFGCTSKPGDSSVSPCQLGDPQARRSVALVGDSHARHLLPGLDAAGRRAGFRVRPFVLRSCPFSKGTVKEGPLHQTKSCERWKKQVRKALRDEKEIDTIVVSTFSPRATLREEKFGPGTFEKIVRSYADEWKNLPKHIKRIIVIRDVPCLYREVLSCLDRFEDDEDRLRLGACSVPRSRSLFRDVQVAAAALLPKRTQVVDWTDVFCDSENCSPVVGHSIVYHDAHHLTNTFSLTLAEHLIEAVGVER